jgi:hypothetical protein
MMNRSTGLVLMTVAIAATVVVISTLPGASVGELFLHNGAFRGCSSLGVASSCGGGGGSVASDLGLSSEASPSQCSMRSV